MSLFRYDRKAIHKFLLDNKYGLLLLFLTWGVYFLVFWPKMLYFNSEGSLTAGFRNIWGDWAMHVTQANAFASQPIFYVLYNHPIYSGIPLSYPFVTNLISGLLMRIGLPLVPSFILPSIFITFILLIGMYIFGNLLTGSKKATFLGISIFITGGGLGFYYYIQDLIKDFTWQNIVYPPHEYTHMKDIGIWWTNTLSAHLVPQRAFLLGMAVGIYILSFIFYHFKTGFKKTSEIEMFLIGLLSGLLAYIHNHTLIVFFFVCSWLFIFSIKHLKKWLFYVWGTVLTALPFFIFFSGPELGNYIDLLPGWLANKNELNMSVIEFWLLNWGILIPVFIAGFKLVKDKYKRIFLLSFVLLFILANIVRFQPSTWDNAKIFLWVYLIFSFIASEFLVYVGKKKIIGLVVSIILFLVLTGSGGIDLVRILNTKRESFVMISKDQIELAEDFKKSTNWNDLVLTSDNHLHWVPVMSGRSVMLGYKGWLWSHGINYSSKENDIKKIYSGSFEAIELIKKYGIDYVVIDKKTFDDYGSDLTFFDSNFELTQSLEDIRVYKVN
jgi:hypothetical protein